MTDLIINRRYRLDRKIGEGGSSGVYSGTDLKLGQEVAIKLEVTDERFAPYLAQERSVYYSLNRLVGIPKLHWYGSEGDYTVMVLDALGPNLGTLFEYCRERFSLKTVLLIAKQALCRLQRIHSRGYAHGDVKPENLTMGSGKHGSTLYIIDFGSSERQRTWASDRDTRYTVGPGGTTVFASIDQNRGLETSLANDLESQGYVLLYLASGTLPWLEIHVPSGGDENQLVADMQESLSPEALCEGLPAEFAQFIGYAWSLAFRAKPDYRRLQRWIDAMFRAGGFNHDNVFDWTERRFHEMREEWEAQL